MWQVMWQKQEKPPFARRQKYKSIKTAQKRTHQAFLLGEFVAKEVNCDTRDECRMRWVHPHLLLAICVHFAAFKIMHIE